MINYHLCTPWPLLTKKWTNSLTSWSFILLLKGQSIDPSVKEPSMRKFKNFLILSDSFLKNPYLRICLLILEREGREKKKTRNRPCKNMYKIHVCLRCCHFWKSIKTKQKLAGKWRKRLQVIKLHKLSTREQQLSLLAHSYFFLWPLLRREANLWFLLG